MPVAKLLSFGTGRYPDKVARRLRVLNFACWCAAASWLTFAVVYAPLPKLRTVVLINLAVAAVLIAIPLLHRFGPHVASVVFLAVSLPAQYVVCYLLGTDSGIQIQYLAYAAGAALIFGVSPLAPSILVSVVSLVFILALEFTAPKDGGLLSEPAMRASFVAAVTSAVTIIFAVVFYAARETARAEAVAEHEYQRSENLLANILPGAVAARLKDPQHEVVADRFEAASVLFADMAGFTPEADKTTPAELVGFLNGVFSAFDALTEKHRLEKIKTTGDNYMVVSGVPQPRADHASALIKFACDMLDLADGMHAPSGGKVVMRIGIASGPVVAGVVGTRKFFYDVWGDAVNVASRMESTGVPGRIQVASLTRELAGSDFAFEEREPLEVRGKGTMRTWLVL